MPGKVQAKVGAESLFLMGMRIGALGLGEAISSEG
jgi:hypothetical protein